MSDACERVIAFVGVGAIGLPMALRIAAAGHSVLAVEASPARRVAAQNAGLTVVDAAAVADADVVIAMVATSDQLESAFVGDDGALTRMRRGSICVIMSTVGPAAAERVGAAAAERGIRVLDVPVTGGVRGAEQGSLTLLAAGEAETLADANEVLSTMGSIHRCGNKIGDGQSYKVVNQLLCSVHLAAAAEALTLAQRLGLDPAQVLDAVSTGAGGSWMLRDRGPRMLADDVEITSTVDIFVKDSGLVADAADGVGFRAPLLAAARSAFLAAANLGHGGEDDSRVHRAYQRTG
jgi:3-hydroxyisobutyrate dehydrogenase